MTRTPSRPSAFERAIWFTIASWFIAVVRASQSGTLSSLGPRFMPASALLVALGIEAGQS